MAIERSDVQSLRFTQVEVNEQEASTMQQATAVEVDEGADYADTDLVRVSIVLDKPSTLEAGFPSEKIAENNAAMAYRRKLQTEQDTITR